MSETLPLANWIHRQISVVETSGEHVSKFVLIAGEGGAVFDTLHAPFRKEDEGPGAQALADQIEEIIESNRELWPARKQVLITVQAETSRGNFPAKWQKQVIGKNAHTQGNGLMSGPEAAAANTMAAFAETMKVLLASSNTQVAVLTQSLQNAQEANMALLDLRREEKTAEALQTQENHDIQKQLFQGFAEQAPALLELVTHSMKQAKN